MSAASIDGAGHLRIFISIMLPLVSIQYFVLCVLAFIASWGDYFSNMVYFPSMPTAAFALYSYQFKSLNSINSVPMQLAGWMLVSLPVFLLFLTVQSKLIGNLQMGGLKG